MTSGNEKGGGQQKVAVEHKQHYLAPGAISWAGRGVGVVAMLGDPTD